MNPSSHAPSLAPDLRLPSIEGLRAFQAVAALGMLDPAAEALHISASAVGKRIGALEDLLGLALFQRQGGQWSLTAAGREYLEQVRAALDLLAAAPQHRRPHQRRERLRLCAPPTFARQILVPALPAFSQAFPHLELELVLSVPYLGDGAPEAELQIYHAPQPPAAELLLRDTVTPLLAPALAARLSPRPQPAELLALPLLRTPLQSWLPWLQAAELPAEEPDEGPRFIDLGLVLQAAECGQGAALVGLSLARRLLAQGLLQRPWALEVPAAQAYALRPLPAQASPGLRALADWLRQHCRSLNRH
ncbi:LysR family transcriptional regulator [Mitsuaria sp. WAJ17]|uniref:LysR substrate-binding domain-containing protein n=1 Tax=Mitsuaria sp. WAJ17 TaxID=2761452 RepID=UPI00160143F9|nr:LysR substrate-binding domain-containing protein [Mitsuaria sp. WAJ17]MBB2483997.1 LysR family transcriptional regulator [Mitsuaria sp. WAJ17]